MDTLSFADDFFDGEEANVAARERRQRRIAERQAAASGWVARIDTPERLDVDGAYVERYLRAHSDDVPSHEMRRLEAICSRLYYVQRYRDCLGSVLAVIRWHADHSASPGGGGPSAIIEDEQLADLAMRASLRCHGDEAIRQGVESATASRHMWHVYAGLALSASTCFERTGQHLDAADACAQFLLLRSINHAVACHLCELLRRIDPDAEPTDVHTLSTVLRLEDEQAARLASLIARSTRSEGARTDGDEAHTGGRHDRSVRTL